MNEKDVIRVLLADDNKAVRTVLADMLEISGNITVIGQAANGEKAVDLCVELQPDVILMDLIMPGVDGVEATRRIHQISPETPVIALSALGGDGTAAMLEVGAVEAIQKNADVHAILDAIRRAVG